MPKYTTTSRDLKTVRESERTISRRFSRSLDTLDYSRLSLDLESMHRAAKADRYPALYFTFIFQIKDVSTDDLHGDLNIYVMELLRQRFKGRFENIKEGEGDISNFKVFSSVLNNDHSMLSGFLDSLDQFFDLNVIAKFNSEVDHIIILRQVTITFKKERRSKSPRKGRTTRRPRSRVRFIVYSVKAARRLRKKRQRRKGRTVRRLRQNPKKTKASYGKTSRRHKAKPKTRSKKLRRIRH